MVEKVETRANQMMHSTVSKITAYLIHLIQMKRNLECERTNQPKENKANNGKKIVTK